MRTDYLREDFESVDVDVAVQLCCLELRRFFKDMPQGRATFRSVDIHIS